LSILGVGFPDWRGSDARALANAFRVLGHRVYEMDTHDFTPWRLESTFGRIVQRAMGPLGALEYRAAILRWAEKNEFDLTVVFLGFGVSEHLILRLAVNGRPIYNFYPDVSMADHGQRIADTLRHYDCVFTTKSFHGATEKERFHLQDLVHVRHGFDPEVHHPLTMAPFERELYECDACFVGTWSPRKEAILLHVTENAPELNLRVYGRGWERASSRFRKAIGDGLRPPTCGDQIAMIYASSRVNLGLLSTPRTTSDGKDMTTTRSFQVPACGGLLLHEDNPEIRQYFEPEREILLFSDQTDLVTQLRRAVDDPELRARIAAGGHRRCIDCGYDYRPAASTIVDYYNRHHRRDP
jgi:spore maturation protein CgeB